MDRRILRALLIGSVLVSGPAGAEPGLWTTTCVSKGRVLYRERTVVRPGADRESEVGRRYPGSVCMVLAPDQQGAVSLSPPPAAGGDPAGPVGRLDGIGNVLGFDAALRVLQGQAIPVTTQDAAQPPRAETARAGIEVQVAPDRSEARPATPRHVRLALYDGDELDDIMADWRRVALQSDGLALYSPTLSRTDAGLTMLSLGPLSERERRSVCVEATQAGFDCLPGEGGAPDEGAGAIESLERSYPRFVGDAVTPAMSPRLLGLASPVDGTVSCRADDGFARPRGIDLTLAGIGASAVPSEPAQRGAKAVLSGSMSRSSKSPDSSLRSASSARARIRSVAGPTASAAATPATTDSRAP